MEIRGAFWRKSSYSGGNGGNCVEVGTSTPGRLVLVRDTANRDGGTLRVRPRAWREFTARLKNER